MPDAFELLLFSTQPEIIRRMDQAGVDGYIVDWEYAGKERRQSQADTQINNDTEEDLRRVRGATGRTVICRVNARPANAPAEIERAIAAGADEILIPMVRTEKEVLDALRTAADRCRVGILIETESAVRIAGRLGHLPLSRIFLGLNDLCIDRRSPHLFAALADGTVERVREQVAVPFGFGGVTLPECGDPIPCRLLIGELTRLHCNFTFMRRSFLRDIRGRDPVADLPRIREAIAQAQARPSAAMARDHRDLLDSIATAFPAGAERIA